MTDVSKASKPPESFEFPDLSDVSREELIGILNSFMGATKRQQWLSDGMSDTRKKHLQDMILMASVLFSGRVSIDDKRLEIVEKK